MVRAPLFIDLEFLRANSYETHGMLWCSDCYPVSMAEFVRVHLSVSGQVVGTSECGKIVRLIEGEEAPQGWRFASVNFSVEICSNYEKTKWGNKILHRWAVEQVKFWNIGEPPAVAKRRLEALISGVLKGEPITIGRLEGHRAPEDFWT